MPEPTDYEVVIRGRASARILRPFVDDFTVDHSRAGVTRLIGEIRDASQLHGVMVHLTSVGAEVISIAPVAVPLATDPTEPDPTEPDPTEPDPTEPGPTDRDGRTAAPTPRKS